MTGGDGVVTTVMFDTNDLDVSVGFWTEVLGLHVAHRDERYVYLAQMSEGGPRLAFQLVPEPKPGKNRLHLDVRVDDRKQFEQRILELGGSILNEVGGEPGYPEWTVVADPLGNEFCIYSVPSDDD